MREARAAASVRHPNVASVFHLGRTRDSYFYAMEFVEGETLEKVIRRSGRLEIKLALEITSQVAAGLAAVDEQNLVHRDIKPSNIMVRLRDGGAATVKIIDLGLAKTVNEQGSQTAISMPGGFAGTPEFASPEQFAGVGVDIRSDLYALGATLWVMVTDHVMFRGSPAEVMYQHQHAPLPVEQLKDLPEPVVVLLEALLEKDPARRFQNPTELLKAMPMVTDAIDTGCKIDRQNLQKMPSVALHAEPRPPRLFSSMNGLTTSLTGDFQPIRTSPGNSFQDTHAACGEHRNSHSTSVNIDDADAFLTSAVQNPHPDRKRSVRFQTEVLAGNLPIFCGLIGTQGRPSGARAPSTGVKNSTGSSRYRSSATSASSATNSFSPRLLRRRAWSAASDM
jgi:serine/threonine protein kinase